MKNLTILVFGLTSITACSNDCVTCKLTAPDNSIIEMEWCDDGKINYTDQNGSIISFDEFIIQEEARGFVCD